MADIDDYAWLTGEQGAARWSQLIAESTPLHQTLNRLRKEVGAERAALLVQQFELRSRAQAKFGTLAESMFFTPELLAQSTDGWIARYVAARFASADASASEVHDMCCGVGGNLVALAETTTREGSSARLQAWDRSPAALELARANVRAVAPAAFERVAWRQADVTSALPTGLWHVDPERRSAGRRSTRIGLHSPGEDVLAHWLHQNPHGAVKLAPKCSPPSGWETSMEWEWISRGRECRQAIAWGGVLARRPGARCATKIVGDPDGRGWRAFHFVGDPSTAAPSAAAPRRYVFDVDPAAVAARLTTALAASHGLETLGPGAVYLTGDAAPDEPLLAAFGVEGVLPLRTSVVADYLRARRVGRVEIKKRGIEVDPEAFARGLRLDGDGSATLFLTRVGTARMTIVARRCVRSEGG